MPMGTKIDDLPIPSKTNDMTQSQGALQLKPESGVKKEVRFEENSPETQSAQLKNESLLSEINEENLLLLVILYLATLSTIDAFIVRIPGINLSPFFVTLIKCALLVLLFIISKRHVLPKVRL